MWEDLLFLSPQWLCGLQKLERKYLNEIHIRLNRAIIVVYSNEYFYLTSFGVSKKIDNSINVSRQEINDIIKHITNYSLYSVEDELKEGYITISGGIRIGVCGNFVYQNGQIKNITDITSLCIRVPHQVVGCSKNIMKYITKDNQINNTLIVSPPGCGKTTLLRDIISNLSSLSMKNISVIDERNEIFNYSHNKYNLPISCNVDVFSSIKKKDAFSIAIRSMNPNVIATDEIDLYHEIDYIILALSCGCNIICTAHANDYNDLLKKEKINNVEFCKYFDLIVGLKGVPKVGRINEIIYKGQRYDTY